MYAVTFDSQSITAEELQSVYDEVAALKDSVTEENVYNEAYLGKLLALVGKLYFAQVDIADTIAADMYDVSVTRSLSEGITGYEVRTSSLYGRVTRLSEGNLYIDVDTDSHVVVSLEGNTNVPKEYMMNTGMLGSMYESIVWEELTGIESVSTITILQKAAKDGINLLIIGKPNLTESLGKLDADAATRQDIMNAVNSGKLVTIPEESVTIGNWTGTGYIVMNPETGAGEYKITGGLNGGSLPEVVDMSFVYGTMAGEYAITLAFSSIVGAVEEICEGLVFGSPLSLLFGVANIISAVSTMITMCNFLTELTEQYYDYVMSGGDESLGIEMMKTINEVLSDYSRDTSRDNIFGAIYYLLKWRL